MERRLVKVVLLLALGAIALLAWSGNAAAGGDSCTSGRGMPATGPCKKAKAVAANRTGVPRSEWSTSCFKQAPRRYECTVFAPEPNCSGGMKVIRRDGRWRARDVHVGCPSDR
jgi:hypothetical protein